MLESVYPTFIMQYVLLSPRGPPSPRYEMFVRCSPRSPSVCQMGRWDFQLWLITVYKSCSCNLNVLPNSVHVYCPTWHHLFSVANIRQHSDSIRPCNLFACLQQNPSNFIKARAAGKCMTADLVIRHASLLSHVLSVSQFSCAEKSRCPVYIPFQLSQPSSDSNYSNYSSQGCEWERGEREAESRTWPAFTLKRAGMQV